MCDVSGHLHIGFDQDISIFFSKVERRRSRRKKLGRLPKKVGKVRIFLLGKPAKNTRTGIRIRTFRLSLPATAHATHCRVASHVRGGSMGMVMMLRAANLLYTPSAVHTDIYESPYR
eukprot:scaffold26818_cov117-Isochrysis_galbana.AAC.1